MTLQEQDGGIRPILCGEIWCRCFTSLTVNVTPVRNEEVKLFTSTYDNREPLFKQQVSEMVSHIKRRSARFSTIVLIPLILWS